MKQRLGIAQALLNDPRLLICDEPTSALDPIGRKEILEILRAVKGKTTVVFSTHVLSDVERICDYVAVLHQGKLVLSGTLAEIKASHRHNGYILEFANADDQERFTIDGRLIDSRIELFSEGLAMTVAINDSNLGGEFLISLLAELQIVPQRFEMMEPTLESLFTEVVQ
jgi:ABC-2 type transport system ATP-binding protein